MAKSSEDITIESAVALHLQTRTVPCTAKQCLQELLVEVRKLVANKALTIKQIKDALKKWFAEGWAVVNKQTLQITRAGRKKIKELADAALASPATG
jgi:coproporphyrinogen III oxidase-like Fe-S oxidoreductase